MKRILITGASGFIGSHVALEAARAGWAVLGTYRSHPIALAGCGMARVELADRRQVMQLMSDYRPEAIVHAAAEANLDRCEQDPPAAERNNVVATQNVLEAAERVGAYVLFLSTDAVFDGERGMYREEDLPNPINVYAATKLRSEAAVLSTGRHGVVRTTINYGLRTAPHQGSFFQEVIAALREGRRIPVFTDQYRSPIAVGHTARALLELAGRRLAGPLRPAGPQRCSRTEFAEAIAKEFNLDKSLLEPQSQDELSFIARRSKDISLDVTKARSLLPNPLPALMGGIRAISITCPTSRVGEV